MNCYHGNFICCPVSKSAQIVCCHIPLLCPLDPVVHMVLNVSCFLPGIIYVLSELGRIYMLTSLFHTFPCIPVLSRHSELLPLSSVPLPIVARVLLCPFYSVTQRVACILFSCFISHRKLFPFLPKLLQTPADWFPLDSAIDLF